MEKLKQRLQTKAAKIKRYEQRIAQYRQNGPLNTDKKNSLQEINGKIRHDRIVPKAKESLRFWGDIWSNGGQNKEAEWLKV